VEDRRVFEIEDIQPAERAGFPPAYFPVQEFLAGLLVYLALKKIAELSPEELAEIDLALSEITVQGARYSEDRQRLVNR